ncbi:DUF3916 domain-containing protein [Pseudomonas haemolytica]|uniref:DUF3916 domain-containing protein n=1 Tax=Pseudomonas haemolytica TaxID=2600065 RepID=A0A646P0K8_9PSED|nr:DUF3916 domain-containing protein [Pseudomonas haemolytica]MRJ22518.1 DUF3916 domain-containing protein [Pseudomonas haemolytica]
MRRLSLTNKKLRNIPRRLKALSRWADSFEGCFYSELPLEHGYENAKIPVIESLVEGKQTTPEILAHCAQQLIRAAGYLVAARPDDSPECWVVASIIIPDMFSSEVCVYTDRSRYLGSTQPFDYEQFRQIRIIGRSLASEWGLVVPPGFHEVGFHFVREDEEGNTYESEHWYFGEVSTTDEDPSGERWKYQTFESFQAQNPHSFAATLRTEE